MSAGNDTVLTPSPSRWSTAVGSYGNAVRAAELIGANPDRSFRRAYS